MCHGPWSTLRGKSIVVIISPPGKSRARAEMLARALRNNIRCTIISLIRKGESSELVKYSDHVIEVPENVDEILSPVLYDIPLHLFAYYRAISGSINPDAHGMDRAGFDKLPRELHPPGWH
jgi:glucosamine 6-phosphate synthetase-like amidotransferase/phosphosugar isomerase protein